MGPISGWRQRRFQNMSTHFTADDATWSPYARPACGTSGFRPGFLTGLPYQVDCGACQRTLAFKAEVKSRKGDAS